MGCGGLIPPLTSARGAAREQGDVSGRRWLWWRVAAALALGRSGWRRRRWLRGWPGARGLFYSGAKAVARWRWVAGSARLAGGH